MSLLSDLAGFDGREVETGRRIVAAHEPTSELFDQLLDLTADADADQQAGTTWLLKAYLEKGAALRPSRVAQLGRLLDRLTGWEAQLHVCQCLRFFEVPRRNVGQYARFLRTGIESDVKFLRAWAVDGFVRLAEQHETLSKEAGRHVEAALQDPAASVRARARHLV